MNFVQRNRSRLVPTSLLCLLAFAVGCGGSGSSVTQANPQPLKTQIAASVQQGFSAQASVSRTSPAPAPSRNGGDAQFDEFYGLYAKPVENGIDFFVDQPLTQAAGTERSAQIISEGGTVSLTTDIVITEGRLKGYTSKTEVTVSPGKVNISVKGTDPLSGSFETTGFFEEGAGEFSSSYTDDQGLLRTYSVRFSADGTSTVTYNTGANYVYTLNFLADGSGTGTVTGANALLPAQIVWNKVGDGQMTFADQSVLEIKGFNFTQI
jgi:hypothetical protein